MNMHRKILFFLLLCLCFTSTAYAKSDLPLTIAGITLGDHISSCEEMCVEDTAIALRDEMYITEINIDRGQLPGVRGGTIGVGNCFAPGTIVRVKIKFQDRSEELFEDLLDLYDKKLGKKRTWQGDAFHIIQSWQWVFTGEKGEKVEILLTYSRNPEFRPGVSVKMTLRSLYLKELECWKKKHEKEHEKHKPIDKAVDLKTFLPH